MLSRVRPNSYNVDSALHLKQARETLLCVDLTLVKEVARVDLGNLRFRICMCLAQCIRRGESQMFIPHFVVTRTDLSAW